ncbi:SDR family oxidoreductase [Phytohabitans flavus]|uniref:Oxidoreductase n=1 Tax=Phytohabitans flavus TaxID=1076124 RepID=A0A6F8Y6W5_9ACTN|nr:SDR family oxidoreductase [Phytohabitans flavus]BCB81856.1 oxidoreductase [Phytohabitans flavus]
MLDGKVLFITGAARGIGEHTARLAAARGATVVLVGLEPERLAAVAAETGGAWFEADVTDQSALDRAAAAAVERYGRIDAVVANAGVAPLGTIAVGDIEAMAHTVQVNLVGAMRTVGATVDHLIASRGYCLLVSSAAAFAALPGMAAYCASKAGVEQFGNAIRLELRHRRVAVGTAHMSFVDTDLVRDVQEDLPHFRETLRRLPWPIGSVTSVEACARAFVDAIERRRRRVYVPRVVGLVQAARSLLVSPLSDAVIGHGARTAVPRLEEQVRTLGRAFGRHGGGR